MLPDVPRDSKRRVEVRYGAVAKVRTDPERAQLLSLLEGAASSAPRHTSGEGRRHEVRRAEWCGSKLILRSALRGGVIGRFVSSWFVRHPYLAPRPLVEVELTDLLVDAGCRVARAAGGAAISDQTGLFYRGAFASVEVERSENLLDIARAEGPGERVSQAAHDAGVEAARVVAAGVLPVDLHLGNVLCAPDGIYLIDFDKARRVEAVAARPEMRLQLLRRWQRSCARHGLPRIVQSAFEEGLSEGGL